MSPFKIIKLNLSNFYTSPWEKIKVWEIFRDYFSFAKVENIYKILFKLTRNKEG